MCVCVCGVFVMCVATYLLAHILGNLSLMTFVHTIYSFKLSYQVDCTITNIALKFAFTHSSLGIYIHCISEWGYSHIRTCTVCASVKYTP